MKVHKMFCIDHELAEKLKSENASALANSLLTEHFCMQEPETKEQLKQRIKKLKLMKKHGEELDEINK